MYLSLCVLSYPILPSYLSSCRGVFSKLMSSGSKLVMEGVKNLVIRSQNLPVTRIVEQLMEQKSSKVSRTGRDVQSTSILFGPHLFALVSEIYAY